MNALLVRAIRLIRVILLIVEIAASVIVANSEQIFYVHPPLVWSLVTISQIGRNSRYSSSCTCVLAKEQATPQLNICNVPGSSL